jgi:hypothetical protein
VDPENPDPGLLSLEFGLSDRSNQAALDLDPENGSLPVLLLLVKKNLKVMTCLF